jgi:NAD(P)-dependent dehydrogenase (short-subunit alcohol dehydrogenase family)
MAIAWVVCFVFVFLCIRGVEWVLRRPFVSKRTDKYILITGCDSGFGHGTAKMLSGFGINVFAACYTDLGVKTLTEYASSRLTPLRLDVTNPKSIQQAAQYVKDCLPANKGLYGLVNNAGIFGSYSGPLDWLTTSDHREVFEVNYFGMVAVTEAFLPLLKKEKGSRIVNTSSLFGRMFMMGTGPYTASKHAVEGYSDVIRNELRPFGISVHIIEPTVILTPILERQRLENATKMAWERLSEEKKREYGGEEFFQRHMKGLDDLYRVGSSDMGPVVRAYEHALFAKWPKYRYIAGVNSRIFWLFMVLPECIVDSIFSMKSTLVPTEQTR